MRGIKKGLVFSFIVKQKVYFGQVLNVDGKSILIVVFKEGKEKVDDFKIKETTPLLLVNTFTARFKSGDWTPISEMEIFNGKENLPMYKINRNDGMYLTDFFGSLIRKLKDGEMDIYYYEAQVGAIRVEKAIDCFFNEKEWNKDYTKLLYTSYF